MSKSSRILLVDTCAVTRAGVRVCLEQAGGYFRVVGEAGNGVTALKLIETEQPEITLLDCRLPDVAGPELIAEVQRRELPTRMLVFCSNEDDDDIRRLLDQGVAGYVLKEEPPEKLVEAIQSVAEGGHWFSQKIAVMMVERLKNPLSVSDNLTRREAEVLRLVGQGHSNTEIAQALCMSEPTARFHLRNIYSKTGLHSRTNLVVWAMRGES